MFLMIFHWSNKWNIPKSPALTPRLHCRYLWHQSSLSVCCLLCIGAIASSSPLVGGGYALVRILTATLYGAGFSKSAVFTIDMLHKTIKETTNCFYLGELYFAEYIRKSKIWDIL